MSTTWVKNTLGMKCTDFELLTIPNPMLELTIHVTMKTTEAGAIVGSIAGPLGKTSGNDMKQAFTNGGLTGALIGLVAGPIFNTIYTSRMNQTEIYDRCYRLRFNRNVLTIDRGVGLGGVVGGAIGGATGLIAGIDLGFTVAALLNMQRRNAAPSILAHVQK